MFQLRITERRNHKMMRYLTAGESHGNSLVAIIEGMPAGMKIPKMYIDHQLERRQIGYGRSSRMKIEKDHVEVVSGLRRQTTIGSPICLLISNRACEKWDSLPPLTAIRPGHADLAGALKYGHRDIRNVLERASARETAVRVAVGAVAKLLCEEMGIRIISRVTQIGHIKSNPAKKNALRIAGDSSDKSLVRCIDKKAAVKMKKAIDEAKRRGDSLGGTFEVIAAGIPPGLGSYVHWDRKLDGLLAQAVMSIQAVKGVEIGLGFDYAETSGSSAHDRIVRKNGFFRRLSNNAGGLEGGVTNGEPVIVRAVMKPIPTLQKALPSIDFITGEKTRAAVQRSDICAVPAASVVAEAVVAIEIAKALQEKFGGDTIKEIKRNLRGYLKYIKKFVVV